MIKHQAKGMTLIELIVSLAIIAILSSVTLPFISLTVKRHQESELRFSLREIRIAIDKLHEDWRDGKIAKTDDGISENGYPKSLSVLVDGVNKITGDSKKYYLRRIPKDPFAESDTPLDKMWKLRSYNDEATSSIWGGQDVYDISSQSKEVALDGSIYQNW